MPGNTTPTTPAQQFPVPVNTDDPDIPGDLATLAKAIEKRVVGVYATAADRNTKTGAAGVQEGMIAYLQDSNTITYYDGAAWQIYPTPPPQILNGTTAPLNTLGNDNDVYYQYT
jgi:hypothetical protein